MCKMTFWNKHPPLLIPRSGLRPQRDQLKAISISISLDCAVGPLNSLGYRVKLLTDQFKRLI